MENKIVSHAPGVVSIGDFWSKEQCDTMIAHASSIRAFPEKEVFPNQLTLDDNLDSRDMFKAAFRDTALAVDIYQQIHPFIRNLSVNSFVPSGIHPDFRVYKYIPGQEFKRHKDGRKTISDSEYSIFSLLIYLNDDFGGGTTCFDSCEIKPVQGYATFFPHEYLHSGSVVESGCKYVFRGNILFKRTGS